MQDSRDETATDGHQPPVCVSADSWGEALRRGHINGCRVPVGMRQHFDRTGSAHAVGFTGFDSACRDLHMQKCSSASNYLRIRAEKLVQNRSGRVVRTVQLLFTSRRTEAPSWLQSPTQRTKARNTTALHRSTKSSRREMKTSPCGGRLEVFTAMFIAVFLLAFVSIPSVAGAGWRNFFSLQHRKHKTAKPPTASPVSPFAWKRLTLRDKAPQTTNNPTVDEQLILPGILRVPLFGDRSRDPPQPMEFFPRKLLPNRQTDAVMTIRYKSMQTRGEPLTLDLEIGKKGKSRAARLTEIQERYFQYVVSSGQSTPHCIKNSKLLPMIEESCKVDHCIDAVRKLRSDGYRFAVLQNGKCFAVPSKPQIASGSKHCTSDEDWAWQAVTMLD